ncbi:unnamed protein product [Caenorhabditis brenneri]
MFFRRCENPKIPITHCKFQGSCNSLEKIDKCRFCRLQRCLQYQLLKKLKVLDLNRQEILLNCTATKNLSLEDIIVAETKEYQIKPENFQPDFFDWGTVNQISAIGFMRNLEFMKEISMDESHLLIKPTYIRYLIICNSMRALCSNREETLYPDGVDMFPNGIKKFYERSPVLLNKVRCQLLSRMRELKVSYEEFLLLSVLFICNPAVQNFTEPTRNRISQQQIFYAKVLYQHCLYNYQNSAHSRYSDLLFLHNTINRTFCDFGNVLIGFRSAQPQVHIRRLFSDGIDQMME